MIAIEGVIFPILQLKNMITLECLCVMIKKGDIIKFGYSETQEYPLTQVNNLYKANYDHYDITLFIGGYYGKRHLIYGKKERIEHAIRQVLSEFF